MRKIFDFNKKRKFPPFPDLMLPDYFGVQKSFYVPGYVIQNKDLGKIHQAALLGDVFKVQHLLLLGKNGVNDVDKKKRTCLHLACANGHPDVVSLLIERKCDLNLLDTDHRTPFMKAIQCEEEECATILLQHGADPNIGDGINNALHYVSFCLGIDLAAKLLHYKADIEAKNKEGLTPLFFAIRGKDCEMAEFLLKNGANVNALDGSKRTTLMVAVSMQSTEMVSLLLKYNVDHTIKDPRGKTAEDYAKIHDFPLDAYVKQTEKHMECNKPCRPQISCSEKATVVPEFVSKASSLNEKDLKQKSEFKRSSYRSKEYFDARYQGQKYAEELQQQLDALSSRNRHMGCMCRLLQEVARENLKQKRDRLYLKHHLELLNYIQVEQYGPKVKDQVWKETEEQLKKLNPLLKIQQEMEISVATSDDASELPSTSRWASPIGHTRRPNLNWDTVSRPTQQYLGNF